MRAWHFLPEDRRLRYDPRTPVTAGLTVRHEGPLVMCRSGLHASVRAIDALQYAPGPIVCRVECGGEIIHDDDKIVCSERTVLWMGDATQVLQRFARLCALDVAHLWGPTDVVLRYLRTGDGALREAAWAAARDAAWAAEAAARAAARAAAWDAAAWDAARAAARDAARAAAAWAAAWDVAWDVARAAAACDAARNTQNTRLHRMLMRQVER